MSSAPRTGFSSDRRMSGSRRLHLQDEAGGGYHGVTTDQEGRFRVEGIIPGMKLGLGLRKGNAFLVPDDKYQTMTLEAGTRDLGDVTAKPFRPE